MHILVNDFIGGVLDRGIPLYVRNLVDGLREEEFRVTVIRAPGYCRKMPRGEGSGLPDQATKAKARRLEQSRTRPAAVRARKPSETGS